MAVDFTARAHHRVLLTRCEAGGFDAVDIFLCIFELQRVFADNGRLKHVIAVVIEQSGEAFGGANASVMVTFWTDRLVFLKFLEEDHRLTALALVPECFSGFALGDEGNGVADAGDPVHVFCPCKIRSVKYTVVLSLSKHASQDKATPETRPSTDAVAGRLLLRATVL